MPHHLLSFRTIVRVVVVVALTSSFFDVFPQSKRIGVSTSYNVPIDELAWTYSPGVGVKLNVSTIKSKKSKISRIMGISIGYTTLPPLADTLYYLVDHGGTAAAGGGAGVGTAVYSPFKLLQFEGSIGWGLPLSKKLSIEPSISVGAVYGKRSASFEDVFGGSDGFNELMTWGSFTPQFGVEYKLGDKWSITPFLSYTLMIQAGSTNPNALNYNENTGILIHFYTPGVFLNYSF